MRVAASVNLLLRSAVLVAATIAVGSARAGCIGEPQGAGRVAEIIDIRTFRMADGAEIRLAGIEPSRDESLKSELAALIGDRDVVLHGDSDMPDRYGRQGAFVVAAAAGPTVQLQLLARGAALASGTLTDRACTLELAAAEAAARRSRLGLWASRGVIKNAAIPGDILAELGRFIVVEGRVLSVREAGTTTYLNFGRRWTQDFAVIISKRTMPALAAAGIAVKSLESRRIRVRGWAESRGGPRIELRHAGQIEALGDDVTAGRE